MKTLWATFLIAVFCGSASALPKVAVFPFQPLMDSTYDVWGDQVKVLNYQLALQSFIVSDLTRSTDVEVVKIDDLAFNVEAALEKAKVVEADFAVIGTFAELPTAIRGDAQLVDVSLGKVPRGYQTSSTAGRWEDLSYVARDLADQLLGLISSSSSTTAESISRLIIEGNRLDLGYGPSSDARLIVEVNSPAPKVSLSSGATLRRCSIRDRSNSERTDGGPICYSGDVPSGEQTIQIEQRGYYGHKDDLSLAPGKVYRLIVELQPMNFQGDKGR
ncbi:MAG: hypothetical protein KDB65_04965 [Calditrichaeota bacterium]|nr:hypothetical protein [Calditrichota bacterium]MCB9368332.1 hypothetical protein [Calditrichota bacterium]